MYKVQATKIKKYRPGATHTEAEMQKNNSCSHHMKNGHLSALAV